MNYWEIRLGRDLWRAAESSWLLVAGYGKCAKTHIIVDWSAGCEMGAVSVGHAGQPGNGFLHQKRNIFMAKAHYFADNTVYRCYR